MGAGGGDGAGVVCRVVLSGLRSLMFFAMSLLTTTLSS